MTFIRRQEEKIALRFLKWRYQNLGLSLPSPPDLRNQAIKIVEDAHRISKERGQNVLSIIKGMIKDLKTKD
jgi:hypothetical protein